MAEGEYTLDNLDLPEILQGRPPTAEEEALLEAQSKPATSINPKISKDNPFVAQRVVQHRALIDQPAQAITLGILKDGTRTATDEMGFFLEIRNDKYQALLQKSGLTTDLQPISETNSQK